MTTWSNTTLHHRLNEIDFSQIGYSFHSADGDEIHYRNEDFHLILTPQKTRLKVHLHLDVQTMFGPGCDKRSDTIDEEAERVRKFLSRYERL